MLICHKIKTIFVAIPKTATRSIYTVLKEQYGGVLHQEHAQKVPEEYKKYFVFCVVRNPYDRACSAYWSMCHRNGNRSSAGYIAQFKQQGMDNTLENFLDLFRAQNKRHQLPQSTYYMISRPDQVLRFETLQDDFNTLPFIDSDISLPFSNSTTTNRTKQTTEKRPPWTEMVNPAAGHIINELYAEDFKLFNYPMRKFS